MPIPFRNQHSEDALGVAGYLRFIQEETSNGIRGAFFLINARGEPLDFAFSRIDVPAAFLWRIGEARRHALVSLADALFRACPRTPSLILALTREVHPKLFTEDLIVDVPICLVGEGADFRNGRSEGTRSLSDPPHLSWVGMPIGDDAAAQRLFDVLVTRNLVAEPFERVMIGIGEALRES